MRLVTPPRSEADYTAPSLHARREPWGADRNSLAESSHRLSCEARKLGSALRATSELFGFEPVKKHTSKDLENKTVPVPISRRVVVLARCSPPPVSLFSSVSGIGW